MYNSDSKGVSNIGGFFILLGLWLAGFILAGILTLAISIAMGGNLANIMNDIQNPANVNTLRLIQVVSTAAAFFLPAYMTALIMSRRPMRFLGFNREFDSKQLVLALALMFFAALAAGALAYLTELIPLSDWLTNKFKGLEAAYASQVEAIANMKSFGDYLIALFMIALLPALFEETFFRGGMQNLLTKAIPIPWLAIIITSIIFSLIHFSYYGFLSRVCLGMVLGLIYYHSGNLWLSILAHMFNNALAITQMYMLIQKGKTVKDAMAEKQDWWWGIIAIVALYILYQLFKKVSHKARLRFAAQRSNDLTPTSTHSSQ